MKHRIEITSADDQSGEFNVIGITIDVDPTPRKEELAEFARVLSRAVQDAIGGANIRVTHARDFPIPDEPAGVTPSTVDPYLGG